MTAWAVTAIRNKYPDAEITWAVQPNCSPVIASPQLVDTVKIYDREKWKTSAWTAQTIREKLRFYKALRAQKFDVGFDFQGHIKTSMSLFLARPKLRLQSRATDEVSKRLNTIPSACRKPMHEVELAMTLINQWEEFETPDLPIMPALAAERARFRDMGDYISIQSGSGGAAKIYPAEKWAMVAELLGSHGIKTVAIGGPGDPEVPGAENFTQQLTLAEALACTAESRVHLAADTGTGHAASAYDVPVVTVFGPESPARFRPWGSSGCVLHESQNPADVKPEAVVEAALKLWEGSRCGS
jgi:ADP-heptose:LPS heptosyltransferase